MGCLLCTHSQMGAAGSRGACLCRCCLTAAAWLLALPSSPAADVSTEVCRFGNSGGAAAACCSQDMSLWLCRSCSRCGPMGLAMWWSRVQ